MNDKKFIEENFKNIDIESLIKNLKMVQETTDEKNKLSSKADYTTIMVKKTLKNKIDKCKMNHNRSMKVPEFINYLLEDYMRKNGMTIDKREDYDFNMDF